MLYFLFFLTTSVAALVVFFGIRAVTLLRRRTQWILLGRALLGYSALLGLLAALVVGLLAGGIYALPFIAVAVLVYVWLRPTEPWHTP